MEKSSCALICNTLLHWSAFIVNQLTMKQIKAANMKSHLCDSEMCQNQLIQVDRVNGWRVTVCQRACIISVLLFNISGVKGLKRSRKALWTNMLFTIYGSMWHQCGRLASRRGFTAPIPQSTPAGSQRHGGFQLSGFIGWVFLLLNCCRRLPHLAPQVFLEIGKQFAWSGNSTF